MPAAGLSARRVDPLGKRVRGQDCPTHYNGCEAARAFGEPARVISGEPKRRSRRGVPVGSRMGA